MTNDQGQSELMLVAGYSGIGKSTLVQEIHKSITKARGYFHLLVNSTSFSEIFLTQL